MNGEISQTMLDDGGTRGLRPSSPTPSGIRFAGGPAPAGEASTSISVRDVLRTEEVARARVFFRAIAVLATAVILAVPFLPGVTWTKALTVGLSAVEVGLSIVVLRRIRDESRYTDRLVTVVGVWSALAAVSIIYPIGLFSAGAMVFCLGIYFFGASRSPAAAKLTYATLAVAYFVATASIAAGWLEDHSLFSSRHVPRATLWYRVFITQLMLGATFALARGGRRATEAAVDEVQRATIAIRQKDALLAEARNELDRALRVGDGRYTGEVLGPYELGEIVGRGGMGEVYAATDHRNGQRVAVKLLHPNLLENPDHVQRFLREARATAALKSPHVTRTIDIGATRHGCPYIVMELLEGHDLGWHLRKVGKLPLHAVVDLVDQVSRALAEVRAQGIVHRDLKPGNLFLVDAIPGVWKVLDFGLSKILGGSQLTHELAVGTPSYMAPEQVKNAEVNHLADLYAVAAIAYRALTGSPPFAGEQVAHILFRVLYAQPQAPAQYTRLPVDVELVLAIGLAKSPADRFPSIEAFAKALRLASLGELDDATRAHGWSLLRAYPWGSTRQPRQVARAS